MALSTIAVIHAAQLLTLSGPAGPRVGAELEDLGMVEDGALLVQDGRVAWTGPTDSAQIPSDAQLIDASGCVLMPGFVDAHTHVVFGGDRLDEFEMRCHGATYEQIAAKGGGIRSTVAKTRAASEDDLLLGALRHASWMIAGGTTAIEAKSGYGLEIESEMKMLSVIKKLGGRLGIVCVPTFLGAHAVPAEFNKAEYIAHLIGEMLPTIAGMQLAEFCDVFCEPDYFRVEEARAILSAARALGLGLRIHADQLTNFGAAKLAGELKTLTADHLEQTDAEGIQALKQGGVIPVLLPGSVYALGKSKFPDAREMIAAGLPVVLATDFNPGSSPVPSMPMVLSLACTQMKMTPAECVTSATINAGYAIGRGTEVGSLEVGKRADFAIHACSDYRELCYYFGFNRARAVYAGGARIDATDGPL